MTKAVAFANEITGTSLFPKIWVNGELLEGGLDDLKELASDP